MNLVFLYINLMMVKKMNIMIGMLESSFKEYKIK
jgi:hypothetical protein